MRVAEPLFGIGFGEIEAVIVVATALGGAFAVTVLAEEVEP